MWRNSSSKIGYLAECFPQSLDAPTTQEILELERQGVSLHIFSLRLPSKTDDLAPASRVKASVTYVPSMLPHYIPEDEEELMGAHVDLLRHNSPGHFKALDIYLTRPEGKQLNELLQAGYVALKLQQLSISHLHLACDNVPTATAELIHHICGIPFSVTADQPDLQYIDPQVLGRRLALAQFILTNTNDYQSYLKEIVVNTPPIYVLPEDKAIAFFNEGLLERTSSSMA